MCESSYGSDFQTLQNKTTIRSDDSILRKLQGKTNLSCVNAFLASIAHKIR